MELYANNAASTLAAAIVGTARPVSFDVASAAAFPATGDFRVIIDSEILLITTVAGSTFTGSNAEGTTAATHLIGAGVTLVFTAGSILRSPGPMTTNGDTYYLNSSLLPTRVPIGTVGKVWQSDGTIPGWAAPTGSGVPVLATSPTLVTPVLGVATATSLNGNTFTAGTYTLTGTAGKTLTFSRSLTLSGTDSTTMTFPSTSATIARTDAGQTFTGSNVFGTLTCGNFLWNNGQYGADSSFVYAAGLALSTANGFESDTVLRRDAAGVIAQRNSTNPQTWRLQNTFTTVDTAGEWFETAWASNVLRIGAIRGSSSGTARVLSIDYGGTAASKVSAISIPITSGDITFGGPVFPTGYKSSDGSAGVSAGPYTVITAITVKNGLITAITGS